MNVNLDNLPIIREPVFEVLLRDAAKEIRQSDSDPSLGQTFLKNLSKTNPHLFAIIYRFIKLTGKILPEDEANESARILITCIYSCLKAIDSQLEINELEE